MAIPYEEEEEEVTPISPGAAPAMIGQVGAETTAEAPGRASGFVNVGEYLEANKPQAQQMGSRLTESYREQAKSLKDRAGAAMTSFEDQRAKATPTYQKDFLKDVAGSAVGLDEAGRQKVSGQLGAQYGGPMGLQQTDAYNPLKQDVQALSSDIASFLSPEGGLGTAAGRERLTEKVSPNQISGGAKSLNELLLSRTPGVLGDVKSEMTEARTTQDYLKTLREESEEQARAAQDRAKEIRDKSSQTLRGVSGMEGIRDRVTARIKAKKAERESRIKGLEAFLGGTGEESDRERYLDRLGINEDEYKELQDIRERIGNPEETYSDVGGDIAEADRSGEDLARRFFEYSDPSTITEDRAISEEESRQMQALSELLGESALVDKKVGEVDPYFQYREGEDGRQSYEDLSGYLSGIEGQQQERAESLRQAQRDAKVSNILPAKGTPERDNMSLDELNARLENLRGEWDRLKAREEMQDQKMEEKSNLEDKYNAGEIDQTFLGDSLAALEKKYPTSYEDQLNDLMGYSPDSIGDALAEGIEDRDKALAQKLNLKRNNNSGSSMGTLSRNWGGPTQGGGRMKMSPSNPQAASGGAMNTIQ
jgi:hypothetical protein